MMLTKTLLSLLLATFIYSSSPMVPFNGSSLSAAIATDEQQSKILSLQLKMENLLTKLESTLENIEEKSNTWSLFKHNIDAWNEQIKSVEHNLQLIKRSQEEQQHKLTALEFTQNHVLSKVVFLSESCLSSSSNCRAHGNDDDKAEHMPTDELKNLNKKQLNELLAQLTARLRHYGNDKVTRNHTVLMNQKSNQKRTKENLVVPAGCNTKGNSNINQLEQFLKQFQRKFVAFVGTQPTKREFQQLQEMAKKNDRNLNQLQKDIQEALNVHGGNDNNWDRLFEHCSSVKTELTTFTASSDLLLKLLETLIKSLHKEMKNRNGDGVEKTMQTFNKTKVQADDSEENSEDNANTGNADKESEERDDEDIDFIDFKSQKTGCHELSEEERVDGIYNFGDVNLNEAGRDFNERYCAFATSGPAWTVIQNRNSYFQQENFNRSWYDYRVGFGSLHKEFWFGNEYIHQLTTDDNYELRIELEDFDDEHVWAEYSEFSLDSEAASYRLHVRGYLGISGDALENHSLKYFSTYDLNSDHLHSFDNCCSCATAYGSGWWYKNNCFESNLNGIYHDTPYEHNTVGIIWEQWHGDYSLKSTRMLIRPSRLTTREYFREIDVGDIK